MLSQPYPGPEPADWRRRLLMAALIGLTALLCAWLVWTQPPEGTVTGVCVDAASGQPLADADVSLSRKEAANTDDEDNSPSDTATLQVPPGWTQDSQTDRDTDLAGASQTPRTEWHGHTDDQGRFTLAHVRAGEYTVSASTGQHESDDTHSVVVTEGQTAQITLPLKRSDSSLSFSETTLDWTPQEDPILPLQGVLLTRTLGMTLERLDIGGALSRKPSLLARSVHDGSDAEKPLWTGEFTPVRHWTYTVTKADKEGSFYERIPLGPLPPGLYRTTATANESGKTIATSGWVRVTNLALVRKTYGDNTLVYVTDLTTGHPVPNAALRLYEEAEGIGHLRGQATTGEDGLARLSAAGALPESQGILVAQAGGSTVALSYVLNTPSQSDESDDESADEGDATAPSESANAPGRSLRSFLYSDRPVYRPGQTVSLKGISRWFEMGRGYVVPFNRPVTLDIRDPQDNLVRHQTLTTNALGSWNMSLPVSPEALTGEYTVKAYLDGHKEQTTFAVAAYQKPEYQATVTFSKDRYVHGDTIDATITATYYYGAPVAGAKATLHAFGGEGDSENHSDGEEDNSGTGGEPVVEKEVTLDGNGQAHLRIPTKSGGIEGDEEYTIDADVTDSSERTVSGEGKVTVAQGEFSLSAAPDVNVCHKGDSVTITATALNAQGNPQAGQDVEISAEYDVTTPDGKETKTPVKDVHAATSPTGQATLTVTAPQAGQMNIHVQGLDRRGNKVTADTEVWVSGDDADADRALPAKMSDLSLILDRAKYQPGQTAHLLLVTAHPGPTALVTVEGSTLYHAFTVPLTRHSNAVDLPVTADDAPSVTIKVCAVNGKQFLSSDGTLTTDDDRRALQVSVSTDKPAYHPGDPATIVVHTRDAQGQPVPAEVSLGVVDSAIYAIKPEAPDTIGDAFQPAQTNAVGTDYSCQTVTLGDVDKGSTTIDIRRKFPDTALWQPALQTDLAGNATVHFTLPDTLTTWRITSYGDTADTRVGKGVGSVVVSKDLLVRLETPPFLVAGDTGRLIGLVHNNTSQTVHAAVHLSAPGLSVLGDAAQTVDVAPGQPARLIWTVIAPGTVPAGGQAPIAAQLTASAGGLSDGVEQPIPLLPHGVIQNVWHSGTLLHNISQSLTLDPAAILGASKLTVRLSPSISTTLLPATVYLAGYPYESTDATASALLADAALASTPSLAVSAGTKARMQNVALRSTLRLAREQGDGGGWGWFSTGKPDLWMTADAAWALARAQSEGLPVPPKVAKAAQTSLAALANTERGRPHPNENALSLATLALASEADAKDAGIDLRWLENRWRSPNALPAPTDLARAALAEQKLGGERAGEAQTLMRQLWGEARQTGSLTSWASGGHRSAEGAGTEPPDAETTAWALLAAETITPADPRIDGAARWLMTARSGDHWLNPAPTATAILALATYMARGQELAPDFQAHVLVNGHLVRTVTFTPNSLEQPEVSLDMPGTALTSGVNTVTLQKVGAGRLYYSLDLKQCLSQPAPTPPVPTWRRWWNAVFHPTASALPPAPSGYRIKRVYLRTTTRRNWLWEDTVPAPDTDLNTGESILVRLIIDAARPASRVVIEEPIPAGCRISESSDADSQDVIHWWDYTDVRDDKIVFFVSDLTPGEHEIDYHLQAATPGAYDIMPTGLASAVDTTLSILGKTAHLQVDARE